MQQQPPTTTIDELAEDIHRLGERVREQAATATSRRLALALRDYGEVLAAAFRRAFEPHTRR